MKYTMPTALAVTLLALSSAVGAEGGYYPGYPVDMTIHQGMPVDSPWNPNSPPPRGYRDMSSMPMTHNGQNELMQNMMASPYSSMPPRGDLSEQSWGMPPHQPMAGGRQAGMPMPESVNQGMTNSPMMQMRQQHMSRIEQRLQNIEAKLQQLIDLHRMQ